MLGQVHDLIKYTHSSQGKWEYFAQQKLVLAWPHPLLQKLHPTPSTVGTNVYAYTLYKYHLQVLITYLLISWFLFQEMQLNLAWLNGPERCNLFIGACLVSIIELAHSSVRQEPWTWWHGWEISLLEFSIGIRPSSSGVSRPDLEGWELCILQHNMIRCISSNRGWVSHMYACSTEAWGDRQIGLVVQLRPVPECQCSIFVHILLAVGQADFF